MRIEIVLDGHDPPEGRLRRGQGPEQAFVGWLGLMRALSEVIGDTPAGPGGLLAPPGDLGGERDP